MSEHSCAGCDFCAGIVDSSGRMIHICIFDQSVNYLQEVGLCSQDCELDGFAEDLWQLKHSGRSSDEMY